jgi:co-chaperonin GroES (HSP10)
MAKKTKFKPYGQWILLPNPAKTVTDSGIILDEKTAGAITTNILEVVSIGPECKFVKVGDTVMVDPTVQARVLHLDEGEFIIVPEYNILGKL